MKKGKEKAPGRKMRVISPLSWWKLRHYRRLKKNLYKVNSSVQLGVAQGIIANCAVALPRSKRRGFLVVQGDRIAELTKLAVERKGIDKLELL